MRFVRAFPCRLAPMALLTFALGCTITAAQSEPDAFGVISARTLAHRSPRWAQNEYNHGRKAMQRGSVKEAAVHFAEAARLDPDFLEAHVMLGTVRARDGQFASALESYLKVVELEPRDPGYRASVALILLDLERPAEAEMYARAALRLAPGHTLAHLCLGVALVEQDRFTPETLASLLAAAQHYAAAKRLLIMVEGRKALP